MDKKSNHKQEDRAEPEALHLEFLPSYGMTDRASVRAFIRSEQFDALMEIVAWVLSNQSTATAVVAVPGV